ncbi:MAG: ribosomal protein small subunit ribosomal protein [Candidatus Parcubacteria bacterium]|jgi:small subunit ribosomal protein S4
MKIGPKFKIAKRLGAPIFEKTQSAKFAISEQRPGRTRKRGGGQASDFKKQLIEKQKMRFIYGVTEKQFSRYVSEAVASGHQPIANLIERLEGRLDNVVYRLGLAKTRRFARQMVAHGHILVNGRRLSVPSHKVRVGDVITVREGSKSSVMFINLAESDAIMSVPSWLTFDAKALQGTVNGTATFQAAEFMFDPELVLEYYSR